MSIKELKRRELIDKANDIGITLEINGVKHPAKISGYYLDYPIIEATNKVSCEISPYLLEKLASGQTKNVLY